MEVVGAIASISQLLSYSFSASKLLLQLVQDLQGGPEAHRHKVQDIRLLEVIIENILKTSKAFPCEEEEVLIPIVIEISTTTCSIHNLLHDLRTFSFTSILKYPAKSTAISEQLQRLDSKREILSFYLVQVIQRHMPRPDSTSQQAMENMGQGRSKQQSGEINISGNSNEAVSGSKINAGAATNTPIAGTLNITENTNKAAFASFINAGLCDPELFTQLWEEVERYGSESNEDDKPYFDAAGQKLNILLIEAERDRIPRENFFSRVSEIVGEARREHPQSDRFEELAY